MKVLIAVPTFENIYPDTYKSLWDLDKGGHEVLFEFIRGYDVALARNKIADVAIDVEADYLLTVDNDMVLPPDALVNLMECEPDVCFGYCARRGTGKFDGESSIFKLNTNFNYRFKLKELTELRDQGRYRMQIEGGGAACALIKTDVFTKITYPWYAWLNYEHDKSLSEDLYFCNQCKHFGIQMYVDTRVACGHIFRYVQGVDE